MDASANRMQLLEWVEAKERDSAKSAWRYAMFRIALRAGKIAAALATAAGAIGTALSKEVEVAVLTAVAGTMTAVLEVAQNEFQVDASRIHHRLYTERFRQLRQRIEVAPDFSDQVRETFLQELHAIVNRELATRPSLNQSVESWA